ncbi:protein of unknown function DUF447 [Methanofollis liminatans DSM 4140]|uniref:DUF447 family protein n=1 Tax=Methanofollis liminatans DSM 4140 TaxID=28892 RepID=J0SAD0_9EURY|nr:DUF447 domain-containing protein [Methanofollis liminatans]EJG07634.1 protein of unknown function DUF447 [Methanofollis liminatans DSM 4140]
MGLLREGINEVIATTRDNAAPMGIICRNGALSMVLFKGSHTEANIRRDGWVVANVTHDPAVWVRTAFADLPPEAFVEIEAGGRAVQRLAACEAWAAFRATVRHETAETYFVALEPLGEGVIAGGKVQAHNRGFAGIIEATVHATRYVQNGDPALKALIDHHLAIVRKCGGPREREAAALLEEYII